MAEPDVSIAPSRSQAVAKVRRVQAVVNVGSGGVGPRAVSELASVCLAFKLDARIHDRQPKDVAAALEQAIAAKPDMLILLAGDGTARLAADMCGPDGPLLLPLAGGTMNMLPHAIYGPVPWRQALEGVLADGVERDVSGGRIAGRGFYAAAIVGSPAWWAPAREAVRRGQLRLAWLRARRALMRAFRRRLRYALDGGEERKIEAMTFICPLVSQAMEAEEGLEACALDPKGAADVFRLGARNLFPDVLGGWRTDASVTVEVCQTASVRAHGRIPVLLDGEPHRLDEEVEVSFVPRAFRTLGPRPPEPEPEPKPEFEPQTGSEPAEAGPTP